MVKHWFLKANHSKFRNSLASIIQNAGADLARSDARNTLGDEHDQCQYFFTKLFTAMRERQKELTENLLCCSMIPKPIVELRYYRSKIRRSQQNELPQFIERETGADFALTINVNLPKLLNSQRSILGQAKIMGSNGIKLDEDQLKQLLSIAGPESAAYMIWSSEVRPFVVTGVNVDSSIRKGSAGNDTLGLLMLGKPFTEFFCDLFLGLWFGKEYNPEEQEYSPPPNSISILYHFLHRNTPPPNVVYFGISSAKGTKYKPGFYVDNITDIDEA